MDGADPGWDPSIPTDVPGAPTLSLSYDALGGMDLIGSGGDADVYRATVTRGGETHTVAVKQPRFESTMHVEALDRFSDEAETWAKLDDHSNVVGVVDWGTEPLPWLALEYMDGGHLGERDLPLAIVEGLWVGWCLCQAVRHAHRRGVAHLDVKPANVLFRETGPDTWLAPKVSDWGLSKLLLEHSGSVRGYSPTYAAPEQVDPDSYGKPDDFTDIYQVGTVLYEALVGEPPFTGSTPAVMRALLEDDPDPPSERNPDLPTAVDPVVMGALSKEKGERPESIVHLRERIEAVVDEILASGDGPGAGAAGVAGASGAVPGGAGEAAGEQEPEPSPEPGPATAEAGTPGNGDGDPDVEPTGGVGGSRLNRRTILKAGGGLVVLTGAAVAANETLLSDGQQAIDGNDGGGGSDDSDGAGGDGSDDSSGAGAGGVDTSTDTATGESTPTEADDTPTEADDTPTVQPRTIKLGILMGVSGGLSSVGPAIRDAALLVATYVNENSDTFTVDVRFEDTATEPDTGVSGARALLDAGYPMYAGALASTVTIRVAREVAVPEGMVGCSPSSTATTITDLDDDNYVYRTTPADAFQSRLMADIGRERLDAGTTSYLAQNSDYGQGLAGVYEEAWEARGGTVQSGVTFEPGKSSYSTELDEALSYQPDLLMIAGLRESGAQILRDFYDNYSRDFCDIIVPDGLKDPSLPDDVDNSMRNVWGTAPLADGPGKRFFEQQYADEYGSATDAPFTAHSWDAAAVLCLANAAAGENTAPAVRDRMRDVANGPGTEITPERLPEGLELAARGEQINYQGASGPITLDGNGDVTAATYELFRYTQDGLETVDAIDFST